MNMTDETKNEAAPAAEPGTSTAASGDVPPSGPASSPKPEKVAAIAVDQKSQLLVARDNGELLRMIRLMAKGMAFPKAFDTDEKIIAGWQVAASLGLPPMVAIQNLYLVHGSVAMWGQLPKALAERTGQLEDFKIILFDDAQKVISLENKNLEAPVWGAVTQLRRTKRSMNEYSFTEPEAKAAGLFDSTPTWKKYRKIMYARRTMGHGIKFDFPDALMGVPVAEYDFHEAPDLKDVTPKMADPDADDVARALAED